MRHVLLLLAFLGDAKPLSKKEQLRRDKRDRECAHGERSGGCENRATNVTRAFPVDEAPAVVDDRAAAAREWAKRLNLTARDEAYPCGGCPATPTRGLVVQNACGGSTWFGDLLDAERCSKGFRHDGWRDGAFRASPAAAAQELLAPSGGGSRGILVMTPFLRAIVDELATRRKPPGVGAVFVQLRHPLFVAICDERKREYKEWAQKRHPVTPGHHNACDPNHPNKAVCGELINFTIKVPPAEFYANYQTFASDFRRARADAARLARRWDTDVVEVRFEDLACAGHLPACARAALGLPERCGRRLERATKKVSPPNPASALRHREAIAAYFEKKGHADVALRVRARLEHDCDGTSWAANLTADDAAPDDAAPDEASADDAAAPPPPPPDAVASVVASASAAALASAILARARGDAPFRAMLRNASAAEAGG
jgi:hypothetical protein